MKKEENKFTLAATVAVLVNNDMHYMHLLSKGKDFDKSHNLSEEYYDKLADEVDYLMELAVEVGAPIHNFSNSLEVVPWYICENLKHYSYPDVVEHSIVKLNVYIDCLRELRNSVSQDDIQSRLDDMIRDWEKEVNYKLKRRVETQVSTVFVNTGLDNQISTLWESEEDNE